MDSRLRRSPPDRASAVPCGRRLPTSFTAPHSKTGMNLISGKGETSSRLPAFSLFPPRKLSNQPGPSQLASARFK